MGLSVIVPVYNGEKYIEDCLRSILNQTYKKLQIIVVNDGSTDNTLSIINNIAKEDNRIEVINKANGGASQARNIGLQYVKNEFVTFVDSDDTLDLDMYEILMKYCESNCYDIVHCGYKRISKDNVKLVTGTGNIYIQNNIEALRCIIEGNLFVGSLWNKIYKQQLFDNISFDDSLTINEDILINYQVFQKSEKSIFIDIAKYNYFERNSSVCNTTKVINVLEDSLKVSKIIYDTCDTVLKDKARDKYISCLINLYRNYYYAKDYIKIKNLKREIKQFYKDKNIKNKKNKLSAYLIIYCPYLYSIIYKIYDRIRVPNWDV